MNIFNKQIIQEGSRLVSNSYKKFFLLSVLWCPIPFQWDGLGMSLEGLEIQKLLSSSSATNGKLLRLRKSEESPSCFSAGAPWPPRPPCWEWFPRLFFGMSSNSCMNSDLKFGREEAFRAEKGFFWSHKMSLSFNWVINWILRNPFGFFSLEFPPSWLPPRWVLWNSKEFWPWSPTSP